jgi:hypothetical protein
MAIFHFVAFENGICPALNLGVVINDVHPPEHSSKFTLLLPIQEVPMSDSSSKTIIATFETREAADLAVEHLVQQVGVDRADIFVQPVGQDNSSGSDISGGDAPAVNEDGRGDAQLSGEIEVSADISANKTAALHRAFGDLGALRVTAK